MSYCRFSCNDHQSDVYAYHDVSGSFATHVARVRFEFDAPLPPQIAMSEDIDGWLRRHLQVSKMVDCAKRVPINGPYDGRTFYDADAQACLERLVRLQDSGYRVPAHALEELRAEIAEQAAGARHD
jgi:hypothetical protein